MPCMKSWKRFCMIKGRCNISVRWLQYALHQRISGATGYLYLTGQRKVLMTDSRYTTQASEETEGYEILEAGGGTGYAELLGKQLAKDHIRAICYEDNQMICADFHKLREACGKAEWVPLGRQPEQSEDG